MSGRRFFYHKTYSRVVNDRVEKKTNIFEDCRIDSLKTIRFWSRYAAGKQPVLSKRTFRRCRLVSGSGATQECAFART